MRVRRRSALNAGQPVAQPLGQLAGATRALARLADQDAQALRTAAVRYSMAERRAGGGAPCE